MYDYKNLNDWEFESLCKDIMQILYNVSLRCFKPGKDGGVDVADTKTLNAYIGQVKNYKNSSFSALYSTLKKEIPKLEKINPKQYYVCTSLPLSREEHMKIFSLFSKYMKNTENILDGTKIDDVLNQETNKDILYKYYKLWVQSTNVMSLLNNQDIMIDAEVLAEQIIDKQNLYVPTRFYKLASQKLSESRALLVTGSPGVGKTTICNMMVLNYLNAGFTIRYSTSKNIEKLKQTISKNSDVKELIYIDDFLGQSYLDLKSNQANEIQSLIAYIKRFDNKYILLNSRITIHNEAKERYTFYYDMLQKLHIELIDISTMSSLDKAKILYNHLYFNDVDEARLFQIKNNKNYLKIINHKNYNPRLIEQISQKIFYDRIPISNYFDFIIDSLDNPKKIWHIEYTYNISQEDRLLLTTLFSLTQDSVSIDNLRLAYDSRIKSENPIDTTTNCFEDSINRLNGSFIKIFAKDKARHVSAANPSINDFLRTVITEPEKDRILHAACFIEQFENIVKDFLNSDLLYSLCKNGGLFQLRAINAPIAFYYIIGLSSKNDITFKYSTQFFQTLTDSNGFHLRYKFEQAFLSLLNEHFLIKNISIIELLAFDSSNTSKLFKHLNKEAAVKFVDIATSTLQKIDTALSDLFWESAKEELIWKIEQSCQEDVEYNLDSLIDDAYDGINRESHLIEVDDDYYFDEDSIRSEVESEVDSSIDAFIDALLDKMLPVLFADGKYILCKNDISQYDISSNISTSEAVDKRIKYIEDASDPNVLYDGKDDFDDSLSESDIIDDIFDR